MPARVTEQQKARFFRHRREGLTIREASRLAGFSASNGLGLVRSGLRSAEVGGPPRALDDLFDSRLRLMIDDPSYREHALRSGEVSFDEWRMADWGVAQAFHNFLPELARLVAPYVTVPALQEAAIWAITDALRQRFPAPPPLAPPPPPEPLAPPGRRPQVLREWQKRLLERQGGRCPLCLDGRPKQWATDHDHLCSHPGEKASTPWCGLCIRGMLCGGCNTRLGRHGDDIDGLRKSLSEASTPARRGWFQRDVLYLEDSPAQILGWD